MMSSCHCQQPPFRFSDYDTRELGTDQHWGDVSLATCKYCQRVWLHYLIEAPHISRSGRWWRVLVPAAQISTIMPQTARDFIQQQPAGFVGGSYFESCGMRITAPIHIY